jgi:2'-5' RNA ligase
VGAVQLSMLDDDVVEIDGAWSSAWRDRIYFAIQPELRVLDSIAGVTASLVKRYGLRGRPRPLDTLSISVLGVGFAEELSPEQVAIAAEAARTVAFRPFALTLTEAVSYRRRDGNALVLRCGEGSEHVNDLAHALFDRTFAGGFQPRGTIDGQPHLTVLYDSILVPPTRLAWPIHLDVTGFALVRNHSNLGRYDRETFAFGA